MGRLVSALGLFMVGLFLPPTLLALWVSIAASPYWGFLVMLLFIFAFPIVLKTISSPITLLFLGFLVLGLVLTWKTKSKLVALVMGFITGIPLTVMGLALLAIVGCVTSGC